MNKFMRTLKKTEQINSNDLEYYPQYVDETDYEDEEKYYDTNYFIQNPFYQRERDLDECLGSISNNEQTALCDISIVIADTYCERLVMKTIKFPPKQTALRRNFCRRKSLSIPNIHHIIAIQIDKKKQLLFVSSVGLLTILNVLTNEILSSEKIDGLWIDFRLLRDNFIIAITRYRILKYKCNNFDSPVWENEKSSRITGLAIELDTSNHKQDLIYVLTNDAEIIVLSDSNNELKIIRICENITKDLGMSKIVFDRNNNIVLFSKIKYRVLSKEGNVLAKLKKHRTEYIESVFLDKASDNIIICQRNLQCHTSWVSLNYPNGELISEQQITRNIRGACINNNTGELYVIECEGHQVGDVIEIYK